MHIASVEALGEAREADDLPGPLDGHRGGHNEPREGAAQQQQDGDNIEEHAHDRGHRLAQAVGQAVTVAGGHTVAPFVVPQSEALPGFGGEAGIAVDADGRVVAVGVLVTYSKMF